MHIVMVRRIVEKFPGSEAEAIAMGLDWEKFSSVRPGLDTAAKALVDQVKPGLDGGG